MKGWREDEHTIRSRDEELARLRAYDRWTRTRQVLSVMGQLFVYLLATVILLLSLWLLAGSR